MSEDNERYCSASQPLPIALIARPQQEDREGKGMFCHSKKDSDNIHRKNKQRGVGGGSYLQGRMKEGTELHLRLEWGGTHLRPFCVSGDSHIFLPNQHIRTGLPTVEDTHTGRVFQWGGSHFEGKDKNQPPLRAKGKGKRPRTFGPRKAPSPRCVECTVCRGRSGHSPHTMDVSTQEAAQQKEKK